MMNKTDVHRNFFIHYCPSQKKTWKNKLIGFDRMKAIINNDRVFEQSLEQMATFTTDTLFIRIKHGLAFRIYWR